MTDGEEPVDDSPHELEVVEDNLPVQAKLTDDVPYLPVNLTIAMAKEAWNRPPPSKRRRFAWPFYVDEDDLLKLDRRARDRLAKVEVIDVNFSIEVSYSDYSSEVYDDFADCFDKATDEADAMSVQVRWSGISAAAESYAIVMEFVTERPLETFQGRSPIMEAVGVELRVVGHNRPWIRSTFSEFEKLAANYRVSKIFRVLEIFGRSGLRISIGMIFGAAAFYITFQVLSNLVRQRRTDTAAVLDAILGQGSFEAKFDEYIRYALTPSPESPLALSLAAFLLPYGLWFAIYWLAHRYLVLLVPRSFVNIGSTKRRAAEYYNTFRFIVFTLILGSILAFIINILSSLL